MDRSENRADAAALLQLAQRCARQVSFSWTLDDDRLLFGDEVNEFLAPGLLSDVRSGADLVARVDPDDRALLNAAIVDTLKGRARDGGRGRGVYEALIRVRSMHERWHWIAMRGNVTETDAQGRGACISGVLVDETLRETERREAVRMRDLYAMLGAVNRAISQSTERHALLTQLCQVAVQHGGFMLAWVGLGDPHTGEVQAYAQAGEPAGYPQRIAHLAGTGRLSRGGLTGQVMRNRAAQVHNDDLRDVGESADWAPYALASGFRGVGCFPLFEQGEPIGGLSLYSREVQHFDPAMVSLLEGLGADVSNALDHLLIKRQQAETHRQLFEANRQFQTAMTASLDGMLVVENDGSIVEMNPAAHQLLACEAGASQPYNLFSAFTPVRLRAAREAQVRRLLQAGPDGGEAHRRIETTLCRQDRSEVPVELVLTPLGLGERGRLMVMVRDLTQTFKQRDQLIDAARRFEQLIEHSPDGILVHIDGLVVLCNGKLREMLGAEHARQLIGKDTTDLLHPDYRDGHAERVRSVTAGSARTVHMEVRLLRLDGGEVEVDMLASDTEFQSRPARQVVLRDIGERKRLERLQASQQAVLGLIAARQPLSAVLRQVARAIEQSTPGVHCTVFVAAEDGASFSAAYSTNEDAADPLEADDLRTIAHDSPSVIARAALQRLPVFLEDVREDRASAKVRAVRRALGAKAVGAWPLLSLSEQLMGVIYLTLPQAGAPSAPVLQLVGEYSDLTAVAIDNERQAARIRHLAQHDVLTGLPNRAMFKDLLDHAIDRARRRGSVLAAMFIDLDRFKLINDTLGHDVGDAVLRETAERLKRAIRECDHVARMGGDEFFVLVDDMASPEAAAVVAQRILAMLALPLTVGDQEHELSASIGIAVYPRDGDDSDALLKHADIAMYRAKQSGRNGYSFFAEADNLHTAQRFALLAQLRRALQKREFVLHYQPRVDLRSGQIRGVEALVRWQHPERGLVMPGDFITLAEESGLIVALGRQVMEMAFHTAPRLLQAGSHDVTMAINLSALQIGSEGFVDEVRDLVARTGIEPKAIEFEITESVLMRHPEQARDVIETLRDMGFSFAIDDFGTGYSSLTYLKRFPVQCVKIDRSFVKDIPGDASDLAITRAIVAMAHSLSLGVVAEGVETAEQLQALRQMGCDQYQGYLFSKPVSIEHLLALMGLPVAA